MLADLPNELPELPAVEVVKLTQAEILERVRQDKPKLGQSPLDPALDNPQ